jgi:hypothetical protein
MTNKRPAQLASLVNKHHALLVYPLDNQKEPPSLWSLLYPKKKMRWEWDSDGDDSVADLWIKREALSRSGSIVYSKWYKGRATFFSKKSFAALLAALNVREREYLFKFKESKIIYELLEERSPQSTKELKKNAQLKGRDFEALYNRALKELFESGKIIAWGEKDEGAFPSLQLGATKHFFEPEWSWAKDHDEDDGMELLWNLWGPESKFFHYYQKLSAGQFLD